MKIILNQSQFRDQMTFSKDSSYANSFSYDAITALFDYYEELEESTGEEIECDPIAIYCEWTEYSDFGDIVKEYDSIETLQDLYDNTQVIEFGNGRLLVAEF